MTFSQDLSNEQEVAIQTPMGRVVQVNGTKKWKKSG